MCLGGGGGGKANSGSFAIQKPPTFIDPVIQMARAAAQRKTRAAAGASSTIQTYAAPAVGAAKTLLGQ